MRKYTDTDIEHAKELRRTKQYSFQYLQELTGIPATTLKKWCKDESTVSRSASFLANNERRRQQIKQSELAAISSMVNMSTSLTKLLVSILYWCEGAKYPASNALIFVNSDQAMIKSYLYLLRKSFPIDESKFRVHLQIHTNHDYAYLKQLWSTALKIPETQFIKPTITEKKHGKHRADYIGTCTVKYQDFKLQLKLIGLYEAFAKEIQ